MGWRWCCSTHTYISANQIHQWQACEKLRRMKTWKWNKRKKKQTLGFCTQQFRLDLAEDFVVVQCYRALNPLDPRQMLRCYSPASGCFTFNLAALRSQPHTSSTIPCVPYMNAQFTKWKNKTNRKQWVRKVDESTGVNPMRVLFTYLISYYCYLSTLGCLRPADVLRVT